MVTVRPTILRALCVALAVIVVATDSARATASVSERQLQRGIEAMSAGVVTVRPIPKSEATSPGSGIVVARSSGSIHVVVPRHVLGPLAEAPGGCVGSAVVTIREAGRSRDYEATRIRCHTTLDLALIELATQADEGWTKFLPTFDEGEPVAASRGYRALVIGSPGGQIGTNVTASVTRSDPSADHMFYGVTAPLESGFSGGAVLTNDLRLVGMHLKGQGATGYALRWSRIREELELWRLKPNLVEPPKMPPNLSFAEASIDTREEAARATLRRYVEAVRQRDLAAMTQVWPDGPMSELRALFGDARDIAFSLTQCGHLSPSVGPEGEIECEYSLKVSRRTGPEQLLGTEKSSKKLTLHLVLDPTLGAWRMQSVK